MMKYGVIFVLLIALALGARDRARMVSRACQKIRKTGECPRPMIGKFLCKDLGNGEIEHKNLCQFMKDNCHDPREDGYHLCDADKEPITHRSSGHVDGQGRFHAHGRGGYHDSEGHYHNHGRDQPHHH
ncbi:protein catecholamines up [Lingula anatina]|uniref:Protein catecholamines up n=1 Tax=Lingula anatina TaxID=7574 RepID=A0A1S3K6U6_LINAN|nr:protein catecholamines up [Lingula anatina]|eukprot:XP_013417976.1 protein catecholamines up [Lingula anatina]